MKKYGKFHKLLSVPGTEGIPLTVVQGAAAGRTVLVSAGVHSLEEVGVQALIRLAAAMDPAHVAGRILFAHCCNLSGFFLHSNGCVPSDGKNLNHCLPGAPDGTEAERLASAIVNRLLSLSDAVIDLHSGGDMKLFCRTPIFKRMPIRPLHIVPGNCPPMPICPTALPPVCGTVCTAMPRCLEKQGF